MSASSMALGSADAPGPVKRLFDPPPVWPKLLLWSSADLIRDRRNGFRSLRALYKSS